MKEVRMTPNIGKHDLDVKIKQTLEFLKKGYQVRASVFFKGRMIVFVDRGKETLLNFLNEVKDYGTIHGELKLVGKRMQVMINPKKH